MIDLSQTRAGFLAAIEAPDPVGDSPIDVTDPRVATTAARVRLRGHTREDLFPLLKLALEERFAAVPRLDLIRDLLMPLRNALGNACKHGNGADPSRTVSVELVLSARGALIAVTDEGDGFDVASTLQCFREHQVYFVNQGAGLRNLDRARCTASYEDGGRTCLLCFRPPQYLDHLRVCSAARTGDARVVDPTWIRTCLSADVPEFVNGLARLESCRVYATRSSARHEGDYLENRYVLRLAALDSEPARTWILTGRLYPTARDAQADFAAASRMREAQISKTILLPRPVARSADEPRLVFYDFDPWLTLGEYLGQQPSIPAIEHCGARVGRALARLHGSSGGQPSRPTEAGRHGREFGWDCIHYGVDGRFYLYPFEWCRRSDPRRELRGYAADLLRFTLAHYDRGVYRRCRQALLDGYNSRAERAIVGSL